MVATSGDAQIQERIDPFIARLDGIVFCAGLGDPRRVAALHRRHFVTVLVILPLLLIGY